MIRLFILSSFLIACCLLLMSLGFWQLERGDLKDRRSNLFEKRVGEASHEFAGGDSDQELEASLWTRVVATGEFLGQRYFLDNRTKNSKAGYEIFAPFQTTKGPILFVSLGWTPSEGPRRALPKLPLILNEKKVTGILAEAPFSGLDLGWATLTPETMGKNNYRLQRLDLEILVKEFDRVIFPLVLYSDLKRIGLVTLRPDTAGLANKHYAYALQWFTMALVLALLGGFNLLRSFRNG